MANSFNDKLAAITVFEISRDNQQENIYSKSEDTRREDGTRSHLKDW